MGGLALSQPGILVSRDASEGRGKKRASKAEKPPLAVRRRSAISRSILTRAIQFEALPRIVLAQRARATGATMRDYDRLFGSGGVAEFAALVLAGEIEALSAYVSSIQGRGQSLERVYLNLLGPAALQLGELWAADKIGFSDVTIGLARLQLLLHRLSPAFASEGQAKCNGRLALLMPVPGEQHTFGLSMVAEFLRRDGWDVVSWPGAAQAELGRMVRQDFFSLVGLSASSDDRVAAVAACIRRIRRNSQNPDIGIMVGGPLFLRRPELVPLVGADATAVDGRQAAMQARHLLDLMPSMSRERTVESPPTTTHPGFDHHLAFASADVAE